MPHDIETDLEDLACPHMVVEFTPFECAEHGDIVDAWECEDCGAEFIPAHEAFAWRGAALELREALVSLGRDHARLRIATAVGAVFTFGLMVGRR